MPIEEAKWTLTFQRGEPYQDSWQLQQSSNDTTWANLATAGYSVLHQIRKTDDESGTLLLDISGGGYVSINDTGLITWNIPAAVVNTLPRGAWFHDLAIVEPGGDAQYLVRGRAVVEQRISVAP